MSTHKDEAVKVFEVVIFCKCKILVVKWSISTSSDITKSIENCSIRIRNFFINAKFGLTCLKKRRFLFGMTKCKYAFRLAIGMIFWLRLGRFCRFVLFVFNLCRFILFLWSPWPKELYWTYLNGRYMLTVDLQLLRVSNPWFLRNLRKEKAILLS